MKTINIKYRILFFGILLVLFATFVFFNSKLISTDHPPTLHMDGSAYKGLIGGNNYFFKFEERDLARLEQFKNATPRKKDIQYYFAESSLSFQDIIYSIKPDLKNSCIVIDYDSEKAKFHTYPKGPFAETVMVKEADLKTYTVNAADGFVIACANDPSTINIKHSTEQPSPFKNTFNNRPNGWHLTVFSSSEDLMEATSQCANRVRSIWVQNDDNNFEKTDLQKPKLIDGYYFTWIKLDGESTCKSGVTPQKEEDKLTIYQYLKQNYDINNDRLKER